MKKPAEAPKRAQEVTKPKAPRPTSPLRKKAARSPDIEPMYSMPREVSDWIERANSTINHQRGEIERLKSEVAELKAYKAWATNRLMRSEHES